MLITLRLDYKKVTEKNSQRGLLHLRSPHNFPFAGVSNKAEYFPLQNNVLFSTVAVM